MDLHGQELWQLFALLAGVGALLVLSATVRIPYPILLVVGGLALAFVPGMPEVELPPEVVLIAFLPPLLYSAAFFTSVRDLRANVRPIGLLSIGLVGATTLGGASSVILATPVVQGLTLPWLIRAVGLEDDGVDDAREEAKARIHAAEVALARLEQLVEEGEIPADTAERLRGQYRFRTTRFQERLDGDEDLRLDIVS